jgi:small GTP-binding protein
MEDDEDEDNAKNYIKVILVGDAGTGKTNLIGVATGQEFNSQNLTTTTCSYLRLMMKINNKEYQVNLWDTIGQEKYRSLTKIFFKDSKIVLFVYDITNRQSFESLQTWKKTIDEILGNVPTIGVVGNKCDLYLNEQVKEEEGKKYADEIKAKFIYTSAKLDAKNFKIFLEGLVKDYVLKYGIKDNDDIKINKNKNKEKDGRKGKKCC